MRILVFQHIAIEHPGILRDFLAADGVAWDAVELDAGEPIPSLDGYDALWVMGGPMDVWEEDRHPWFVPEKRAIREAVAERRLPYLGLCLGHQLLAAALGGRVGKMAAPEVGVLEVELTQAARTDALLAGLPSRFKALQWHGAEVSVPPPGAVVLARSPACAVQAMRVGAHAWGIQYHVELTARTVGEWGRVPAYARALDDVLGKGSLPALDRAAKIEMERFNAGAKALYDAFMTVLRARARAAA
jgi:GMP synthase-like glutamine amidotransferase